MQVRVLVNCDSRTRTAMFRGQVYDLPTDEAAEMVKADRAEYVTVKAQEPVENKAVEAAPSNKGAIKKRATMRKRG